MDMCLDSRPIGIATLNSRPVICLKKNFVNFKRDPRSSEAISSFCRSIFILFFLYYIYPNLTGDYNHIITTEKNYAPSNLAISLFKST